MEPSRCTHRYRLVAALLRAPVLHAARCPLLEELPGKQSPRRPPPVQVMRPAAGAGVLALGVLAAGGILLAVWLWC